MRPADSDSSEDESAAAVSGGRTGEPAARPSSAQEGAPAAIPIKERVSFLKSLSNLAGYLLLVEGIKDLKKQPNSEQQQGWPTWATWSWERSYLPDAVHTQLGTVETFLETAESAKITTIASGMRVTLGLGLLLKECKRAIEYEADDAPQNTPSYIGNSVLGINILNRVEITVDNVRGRILQLVKGRQGEYNGDMIIADASANNGTTDSTHSSPVGEKKMAEEETQRELDEETEQQLEEDLQKLEEAKKTQEKLKEDMQRIQEEKRLLEEETKRLAEANESLEREILKAKGNDDDENVNVELELEPEPEVTVELKGKKRSKSGGSGKPTKIPKTDEVRRSSRARLPSKKAMIP
ncbi:hypothetical protein CY34DRAFT_19565 [Suillus luteus UH-Slu-Lm8-n1]|uniref:Uncharacterized protein n=1 Tax=Suillus luteus UH-Slu-Lm8-n1 TaxID=930992 RepID=A0A0D0A0T3_9AGAM|nr:hypothetical protein CY34DRAFT_19565 [Suillus luteus UH-Slu-Lm8-n1]